MIKLTTRAVKALICVARTMAASPARAESSLHAVMRNIVGPRQIFDEEPYINEDGDLIRWPEVDEAVQEAELARQQEAAGPAINTNPLIERIVAILNRGAFSSNFMTNSAYRQLRNALLRQDEINALANRLSSRMECSCGWVFQPGKCELVTLCVDANGLPAIKCPQCKAPKFVRCDKSGCMTLSAIPATLSKRLASMSCEKNGGELADGAEHDAPILGGVAAGAAIPRPMGADEIGPFQQVLRRAERDRLRDLMNDAAGGAPRAVRMVDIEAMNQRVFAHPLRLDDNPWVEIGPDIEPPERGEF